ncbi:WD40 repeat-like protein [Dacryopinax primogenitus]|uniref:Pre-rRNA-processing protein IPI3 n=1 Tax=Dacryopinax primogenitus (strain DJM 731) TaxID=1858805 RepID=M5GBT3_DACPD|nr:WD40 repeat-like protein [Dacryopinax primogenitus]EJU03527.1 WD40 repeat-like protein [Dacryopinax primogenitus]
MVQPQEVILCAVGPSSPASGAGGIYIHDLQTGTTLASFKQTSAPVHCTTFAPSTQGQGGVLLAAQSEKTLVHAYSFQKDQIMLRIAVPEKLSCLAIDRQGRFCAGGTSQGRLYLWEVSSGILFAAFDAHYRAVNVVRFSDDGTALATGSEDSGVSVWLISSLLDNELQTGLPMPYWMPTDHTLAVMDLQWGMGAFPGCRLFTVSLDSTCKIWDITTKTLMTTFVFPSPLSFIAVERTERTFFAASAEGEIFQMNLFRQRPGASGFRMEAVGGGGGAEAIRLGEGGDDIRKMKSEQPLRSLTISLTSAMLLAGTIDGSILIYDIPSHQLIRSLNVHKGYTIDMVATLLRPPDLLGHAPLGFGNKEEQIPILPIAAFQRVKDQRARERHDVPMMLLALDEVCILPSISDQVQQHHSYFLSDLPSSAPDGSVASLQTRVSDLENEVAKLRGQLGRAKGVNDTMWETVVRSVLKGEKDGINGDEHGPEEGRRKRQRVAAA